MGSTNSKILFVGKAFSDTNKFKNQLYLNTNNVLLQTICIHVFLRKSEMHRYEYCVMQSCHLDFHLQAKTCQNTFIIFSGLKNCTITNQHQRPYLFYAKLNTLRYRNIYWNSKCWLHRASTAQLSISYELQYFSQYIAPG